MDVIHELNARLDEILFGNLYKRVAGVTIVGKAGMGGHEISDKLIRISVRSPAFDKMFGIAAKHGLGSKGKSRDTARVKMRDMMHGNAIGGTVVNKRVYINRATIRDPDSAFNLRELVHHEKFHRLPIIGHSETAAHFVGGLMREKGRLHPLSGLQKIGHLARTNPVRLGADIGVVAGGALIARKITKRKEEKNYR